MSDDFIPFWTLLATAEDQLQWGTEPDTMEATARSLARRRPASVVAESLMDRAAYLRAMRNQSSTFKTKLMAITARTTPAQAFPVANN